MGPDGHLYVTTSNCDGRGECGPKKDLLLRVRR
nr:PQQ-dependent sugar dehydrogenase [Corallococcus sp. NCSPR001]